MSSWFHAIAQIATNSGSRSNALRPLLVVLALLIIAFGASFSGPPWAPVFVAVLLSVDLLALLACFVWFGRKNPDLLRSERYALSRHAIEHGWAGDDVVGLIRADSGTPGPKLIGDAIREDQSR